MALAQVLNVLPAPSTWFSATTSDGPLPAPPHSEALEEVSGGTHFFEVHAPSAGVSVVSIFFCAAILLVLYWCTHSLLNMCCCERLCPVDAVEPAASVPTTRIVVGAPSAPAEETPAGLPFQVPPMGLTQSPSLYCHLLRDMGEEARQSTYAHLAAIGQDAAPVTPSSPSTEAEVHQDRVKPDPEPLDLSLQSNQKRQKALKALSL